MHVAGDGEAREVVVVEELPRNPTGKVMAADLRAMLDPSE